MEGENYGMTELEEWVEFFEEKGCEECAGLSDFRISLKDAYTRWLFAFGLVLRRRRRCCAKALVLGEKFKKHLEYPMPWTEGTHRVVRETTELVGGLVDEVEEDRLEREAQERHVKRMQIMGDGAFGGLRADWVLGGVAATAPPREADSSRMNQASSLPPSNSGRCVVDSAAVF